MLQCMDKSWKHAKWKKPFTKDHILNDSIYMKRPQHENSERQEVD